ncbi:hypothetical protein SDC9_154509 [bioreactor metagenome]|uniref:Uncharacterized protein n=1 Tax=bioreactor metagenome TaxID=1076179 RepID=A0A645F3U1_9ZZZZ
MEHIDPGLGNLNSLDWISQQFSDLRAIQAACYKVSGFLINEIQSISIDGVIDDGSRNDFTALGFIVCHAEKASCVIRIIQPAAIGHQISSGRSDQN